MFFSCIQMVSGLPVGGHNDVNVTQINVLCGCIRFQILYIQIKENCGQSDDKQSVTVVYTKRPDLPWSLRCAYSWVCDKRNGDCQI